MELNPVTLKTEKLLNIDCMPSSLLNRELKISISFHRKLLHLVRDSNETEVVAPRRFRKAYLPFPNYESFTPLLAIKREYLKTLVNKEYSLA